MKLILFSGFLGAGKTTLILSLAKMLSEGKKEGKPRLVIIENEIGKVGIDNKLLSAGGFEVKELLAGCICCTLKVDLMNTLRYISEEIDPEYVIFEPTGMAEPGSLLQTIVSYDYDIADMNIITVVDASRFFKYIDVSPYVATGQLKSAGNVIINKCDLVEEAVLDDIVDSIREYNTDARIFQLSATGHIDQQLWQQILGNDIVRGLSIPEQGGNTAGNATVYSFEAKGGGDAEVRGSILQEKYLEVMKEYISFLNEKSSLIGHVKLFIENGDEDILWMSSTGGDADFAESSEWEAQSVGIYKLSMTSIAFGIKQEDMEKVLKDILQKNGIDIVMEKRKAAKMVSGTRRVRKG